MDDERFDPYYLWLGIPPEEQPPNLYRLLGINPLEANLDVINAAADRQMAHVRTFQTGKHAAFSQQILNELAAARIYLIKADKKAAYDAELSRKLAASQPSPPHAPPVTDTLEANSYSELIRIVDPLANQASARHAYHHRDKSPVASATRVGVAVVVLLLLVGIVTWALRDNPTPITGGDRLAQQANAHEVPQSTVPHKTPSHTPRAALLDEATRSATTGTTPGHRDPAPSEKQRDQSQANPPLAKPVIVDLAADSEPSQDEPIQPDQPEEPTALDNQPAAPEEPAREPKSEPPTANPVPPALAEPQKYPLPDEAARAAKEPSIQKLFDIAGAHTQQEKLELAKKLLQVAQETAEDPVEQYVLFDLARAKIIEAGEIKPAIQVITDMAERFDIVPETLCANSLIDAAKNATSATQRQDVATEGIALIAGFIAADEFDKAAYLNKAIVPVARETRNAELINAVAHQRRTIDKLEVQFAKARPALEAIVSNPDDPQANLVVGRYLAFAQQDWQTGIKHLAKCDDPQLSAAAKLELANPQSAEDRLVSV